MTVTTKFAPPANALLDIAAEAIDQANTGVPELSGSEATSELRRLRLLENKLEAYRVGLIKKVRSSEIWREQNPNGTPASFLRQELNLDQREVTIDLKLNEACDKFPELDEAINSGAIRREAANLILGFGLRNHQRKEALPQFLNSFIDFAEVASLSQLRRMLASWADQIDPLTTALDESEAVSRRYLHVSELADGVKIDAFLDKVSGKKVLAALNAAYTAYYNETHREGKPIVDAANPEASACESGKEPAPKLLDAVAISSKMRADAFVKMIVEPICEGRLLPRSGGLVPNATVTVSIETLGAEGIPRQVVLDSVEAGDLEGLERNSAAIETTNGPGRTVLSQAAAKALTCDANVQRIVLDPNGVPLDVGRVTRVIPPHMRRALAIRDGGCQFPYCEKPVSWCEGHHIQHWANGGPTSLNNLVLLCTRHHHEVHSARHEILLGADGRPRVKIRHHLETTDKCSGVLE